MPQKPDFDEYPLVLKLILAQLVVQQGTDSFRPIAEELEKHPLLKHVSSKKMTANRCRSLYLRLLENEGLELEDTTRPESAAEDSSLNAKKRKNVSPELKLAQVLYMSYTEKILQEIQTDESDFKQAYAELLDLQKKYEETEKQEVSASANM